MDQDDVRARIEALLPRAGWRVVLALASGLLTYVATTGGLFIALPWAQSAVVAGIAVGLVAPGLASAALVGAAVGLAGVVFGPANFFNVYMASQPSLPLATMLLGSTVACAAVAAASAAVGRLHAKATLALLAAALLLLIGNLWSTTLTLNALPGATSFAGKPLPAFDAQLRGDIPKALDANDGTQFFYVYRGVKAGARYYPEYATVFGTAVGRGAPRSVVDFRVPVLTWLWAALPDAGSIVIAFLVLASLAVAASVPIAMSTVKAPLALPAAAALASYMLYFLRTVQLFRQEGWAGALGVIVLALMALSVRSKRWRAWTIATVACAVLAVLTREVMAFLLLAGPVSALLGDTSQRRFRLASWGGGIVVFAAVYGAHALAARPFLVTTGEVPRVGYGGVAFMMAALDFATSSLGRGGWLPFTLAALGIAGASLVRDARLKSFALIATLAPLASFLVLGNNAYSIAAGGAVVYTNYWGPAAVPLLYALLPAAFRVVPAAGRVRRVPAHDTGEEDPAPAAPAPPD